MHSEEPDLKVNFVDDDDDDDVTVAEKFALATLTGSREVGLHGDHMPVTPERESSTYLDPDIAFSSLSSVEKYVLGKAMFGADISECQLS